jgi:hypothetical protein
MMNLGVVISMGLPSERPDATIRRTTMAFLLFGLETTALGPGEGAPVASIQHLLLGLEHLRKRRGAGTVTNGVIRLSSANLD